MEGKGKQKSIENGEESNVGEEDICRERGKSLKLMVKKVMWERKVFVEKEIKVKKLIVWGESSTKKEVGNCVGREKNLQMYITLHQFREGHNLEQSYKWCHKNRTIVTTVFVSNDFVRTCRQKRYRHRNYTK